MCSMNPIAKPTTTNNADNATPISTIPNLYRSDRPVAAPIVVHAIPSARTRRLEFHAPISAMPAKAITKTIQLLKLFLKPAKRLDS